MAVQGNKREPQGSSPLALMKYSVAVQGNKREPQGSLPLALMKYSVAVPLGQVKSKISKNYETAPKFNQHCLKHFLISLPPQFQGSSLSLFIIPDHGGRIL